MNVFKKIFVGIIVAVGIGLGLELNAHALPNISIGDISEFGEWATDHNRDMLTKSLIQDITDFQSGLQNPITSDFVPPEAKIGLAFMNALSFLWDILDTTLVNFAIAFMLLAYAGWTMLEGYNMVQLKAKGSSYQIIENIIRTGVKIGTWIIVLKIGASRLFMLAMTPILTFGTKLSNFIMNSTAQIVGTSLPDTCGAIHAYAAANTPQHMLIDAETAANIMCMPTRLTTFFYSGMAAGGKWLITGIGYSTITFLAGAIFLYMFGSAIWKFSLVSFGVIADLFLVVLMLPFTALKEAVPTSSTPGIPGTIFNGFLKLVNAPSLDSQIQKFISAVLYFIALSVVVAISAGLLSTTMNLDLSAFNPHVEIGDFAVTLLTVLLILHILDDTSGLIKKLGGGSIDTSIGTNLGKQATNFASGAYKRTSDFIKTVKKIRASP